MSNLFDVNSSNVNFSNNITNHLKPNTDLTNVNIRPEQLRVSDYEILNTYDSDTLQRMSTNEINYNTSNKSILTRQIPQFSDFVSHRDPSLDFGMRPGPIQNMTVLPNQLHRSLDLLSQTDQLNISEYNKKSDILSRSNIISSNEITEPIGKFQGINTPYIPYDEYNKPTAYFDNFIKQGKTDIIREYICYVNSIDRDIQRWPNPFNFLVKLAPLPSDTDASISRIFTNIRYLKVETVILPRIYYINRTDVDSVQSIIDLFPTHNMSMPLDNQVVPDSNSPTGAWVVIYGHIDNLTGHQIISYCELQSDAGTPIFVTYSTIKISSNQYQTFKYQMSNMSIENDKYTIMYLNDINDVSQFSTDQTLSQAFNVLYPNTIFKNSIHANSNHSDKIYKFSDLGNINKMQLRLTNSIGKILTINTQAIDKYLPNLNSTTCTCTYDKYTGNVIKDYKCICSYIRHPRYLPIQINIMFKFGIVETDFDKRIFN